MNWKIRWLTALGMMASVVALVLGAAACGDGDSASEETTTDGDEALHEEAEEPDAHEDPEAHAYLEAAPKDALYLVEMTSFAFTPQVL